MYFFFQEFEFRMLYNSDVLKGGPHIDKYISDFFFKADSRLYELLTCKCSKQIEKIHPPFSFLPKMSEKNPEDTR